MADLLLNKDTAGPQEWVTAMQRTPAWDFTRYPRAGIIVSLVEASSGAGSAGSRSIILPDVQVRTPSELMFKIPDVGPNDPRKVPEGRYHVTVRLGMAAVLNCDPILRVRIVRAYVLPLGTPLATFMRHAINLTIGAVAGATRPLLYPFSALASASLTAAQQAQQRYNAFWGAPPAGVTPNTVELHIDGIANYLAIDTLCRTAEHYAYLCVMAMDEDTRLTAGSQTGPSAGAWHFVKALSDALQHRPGTLDVKVLVWEPSLPAQFFMDDDLYASYFTDLGALAQVQVRWGDVRGATFAEFQQRITSVSGAPINFLNEFRDRWYHAVPDTGNVWIPTGVHVATQKHPAITGGHHQKFVLSDRGLWLGGLNFQKHYWDAMEHYLGDMRRSHSGEGFPRHQPNAPDVMPWHDTGATVRGPASADAGPTFEQRWNPTIANQSAVTSMIGLVRSSFSDLARRLESFKPRVSGLVLQHRHPSTAPGIEVDQAVILETLPASISWTHSLPNRSASAPAPAPGAVSGPYRALFGLTGLLSRFLHFVFGPLVPAGASAQLHFAAQNLQAYMESIRQMDEPFKSDDGKYSFIYLENQYFTHPAIARELLERWKQNVQASGPDLLEYAPPFAFVLLPYVPQPTIDYPAPDLFFVTAEMMLLKWLELRTARTIFTRTPEGSLGYWCKLRQPEINIRIDGAAHDDPEQTSETTRFTVVDAAELDPTTGAPTGGRIQNESRKAEEVLTVSDMMAYTMCANLADNTVPRPIPHGGGTPRRREKDFLLANHIYQHSKVALFTNDRGKRFIGSVGSANLNYRSLGKWNLGGRRPDPSYDTPDSEMNVWFKGQRATMKFRDELWSHLLGVSEPDATVEKWIELGERNLRRILDGAGTLEGFVVRLDVVARYRNV